MPSALTGSAAFAADLPSRAPPPVYLPPPPIWTGLYVGINAGYTWSNNNTVETDTVTVFPIAGLPGHLQRLALAAATGDVHLQNTGFIGGGQIGYNYQFANSWASLVAGIEADIQGVAGGQPHRLRGTVDCTGGVHSL